MVVPIGIDPFKGVVAAYSTLTRSNIEKITPCDIDKIDNQFLAIKERFPAVFVNVCVCLDGKYSNDIRMAFIENAKKHNFANFSLLDFISALYIHAVFKSAFISKNGDKIWIIWNEKCYVYQHIGDNVVFLKSFPSLAIINSDPITMEKPEAIYCQFNFSQRIDFGLFSDSKIFYFSSFMPENAALIKAQFPIGNNDTCIIRQALKVKPCCSRKIEVFINGKSFVIISPKQSLPYEKVLTVTEEPPQNLKIVEDDSAIKVVSITSKHVKFIIDLNGIYTIENFENIGFSSNKVLDKVEHKYELNYPLPESTLLLERHHGAQDVVVAANEKPASKSNIKLAPQDVVEKIKEPALLPLSNIKSAMPKYITPEKFEHSVEMIRQIGSIQTELNILNPLIAITKTQFTLAKFEYLQKCHISYKPAIVSLGTLIENAKMRVNSEIDKFGGNYLKDLTDSVFTKHKILKQNYDKNEVFLQKAETYLTVFHEEVKWINSRLENDEIKFDSSENSLNALKMFEKLEQEVRDREESYQKVINDGKEYILKNNKNTAEEFINLLEDKWKQLQEHIEFYATIFRKVRKAVECGNKATVIREWIKVKSKMLTRNDSNTGSEIIKDILMKKTEKLLDEVETYFDNIQALENETNSIKSEIILSGNATMRKLSVILDHLQIRLDKIKKSYNKLKENVKDQIKKLDDEKNAFDFNKKCNTIEHWIKQMIKSLEIEVTSSNVDVVKKCITDAENSKNNFEKNEISTLTKIVEELVISGFPEAELKMKNIEKLLDEREKLLEEKKLEIEEIYELNIFISNCDIIIQRIQIEIAVIDTVTDNTQMEEHKNDQKRFNDNVIQLIKTCSNFKNKNFKYVNEMEQKIKELEEMNESLMKLIVEKSQISTTDELTKFYDNANEILEFLELITSEIEWSDAIETTSNIFIEDHLKVKERISAKESEIEELKLLGKEIMQKIPTLKNISEMLEEIAEAKEKLDQKWEERYKEYQSIENVAAFNSLADETINVLTECYQFLENNKTKNMDKAQLANMLAEVNSHIDNLQITAHNVIKIREDLTEYINKKVLVIMDMQEALIKKAKEEAEKEEEEKEKEITSDDSSNRYDTPKIPPHPVKPVQPVTKEQYFFPKKISTYDETINAIGIDLGTSRCCMAVSRNNKMETVGLENTGERPLPSFVAFDEEDDKCGVVVVDGFLKGKEKYTVFDVKRFIGKEFHDIVPDRSWPFEVIEENGKVKIKTENINGEVLKTPEEISAVLLKYMKEKAKEFQGKDETKTVLTVPAAFSEKQKQATLEAAKLAGWKTIHLLPEPIAASFAYFNNREIPNNSNILLFDLGGGTLDVCLFKIIDQKIEFISKFGDICLGGRDIDNLLIRHFSTILRFRYNININEKIRRKYQLMLECQSIKQNLTVMKKDTLNVETFDSNINGVIEIERSELEELMTDLLQRMKTAINQTLNNANLAPKEIHKILQVGGGCRMPIVKEMLKNMFPNSEHCVEENPDEVVAVGAAIYAYHLATINDEDKNV